MNNRKKLNLLPAEVKNKYVNKYMTYTCSVIGGFFILLMMVQYIHIGILSWQTNRILENNEKYEREKETIEMLKGDIEKHEKFLGDYESECFPFSRFMEDLEYYRPSDVYIISVDSTERLVNEGGSNDKESVDTESVMKEKNESTDNKAKEKQENQENEKPVAESNITEAKIEYTGDLNGRDIVIRGFGGNQESISKFIYDITHMSYVSGAKITAIEEHKIEDGIYNIFEIIVTGGVYN